MWENSPTTTKKRSKWKWERMSPMQRHCQMLPSWRRRWWIQARKKILLIELIEKGVRWTPKRMSSFFCLFYLCHLQLALLFFLYIRILKSNLNVLYLLFVRWLITLNLPQSSTRFFSSFFLFNRSRRKRFSFSMSNFLSVCVVFAINKKIGHASHS